MNRARHRRWTRSWRPWARWRIRCRLQNHANVARPAAGRDRRPNGVTDPGLETRIAHTRFAAALLQLAAFLFARDPPLFRAPCRLRGTARWVDPQRFAQALDETILRQSPVARLAPFVVDHDPDLWSETIDHALSLHRSESGRGLQIQSQL